MRYGPFRGIANVQQRREEIRKLPSILIYKERTERTDVGVCASRSEWRRHLVKLAFGGEVRRKSDDRGWPIGPIEARAKGTMGTWITTTKAKATRRTFCVGLRVPHDYRHLERRELAFR